jgi:hypothetical protein
VNEKGEAKAQDEVTIARIVTQFIRVRVSANLKALVNNSDSDSLTLADSVLARGGYGWDVL